MFLGNKELLTELVINHLQICNVPEVNGRESPDGRGSSWDLSLLGELGILPILGKAALADSEEHFARREESTSVRFPHSRDSSKRDSPVGSFVLPWLSIHP